MDVRKMMGRLNPAGMRYEMGGSGGVPMLTQADIAGALGMVRDDFAREVFCAVWWPDGAKLTAKELDAKIRERQLGEWMRRARLVEAAKLAMHLAEEEAEGSHAAIQGVQRALSRARAELTEARAVMWPSYGPRYALIRVAVLTELASPQTCRHCAGRGSHRTDALVVTCHHCGGTGRKAASERSRADAVKVGKTGFRHWEGVYDWTLQLCASAERDAAKALKTQLKMVA